MAMVPVLVAALAVLTAGLYLALRRRYSTWKRKGVPGPESSIFPLAVPTVLLGKENVGDVADRIYRDFRDAPVAGGYLFGNPVLHIHDPEIIKQVFIKEFQDFQGRGVASSLDHDPLSAHLFFQSGQRWRDMRVKLVPTFTTGKIKYMFNAIKSASVQLNDYLADGIAAGGGCHDEDARELMMRLFVDTISSVAFGIETNVVRHPNTEFHLAAQRSVAPSNNLRFLLSIFVTQVLTLFRIRSVNAETIDFFGKIVRETVKYREENKVDRADMLNLLIQLKNQGFVSPDSGAAQTTGAEDTKKLTMDEVAAQVFIFFVAGFESSSSTTSFTLYEMVKNPEIAAKIYAEVDDVTKKFDGQITYDAIMSMPYLDKAVNETIRKYPPLNFLTREAMVKRKVPLTEVVVDKGTRLVIPVRALHYDEQYWPEPHKYDPERFSDEQKKTRPAHVYLPFGDGPRICPANRLGLVQIKTALLTILSKYKVSACPSTPAEVGINPTSFATTPDRPLHLRFQHRAAAAC